MKDVPGGAHLIRVWIPLAVSDSNQKVLVADVKAPVSTRITREGQYGNQMLYAEISNPKQSTLDFSITYHVTRKQYSKGDYKKFMRDYRATTGMPANALRFLKPDRLVPIDGRMKGLADEITRDRDGAVEKVHALYTYVFKTMRYDKSGSGWGRGDAVWACDAKHGNCTDFHSLFISLARAEHIPARFEIGFPIPEGKQGAVPGYHRSAEFYVNRLGQIPVDISEAWKNPSDYNYFFGSLDANRLQFSMGRDLTLVPKQEGPPLNYFVYPYVEIDGRPFEGLEKNFAFAERAEPSLARLRIEGGVHNLR